MVVVRPRQVHGQASNKMPFPVDVRRLREAYEWLKVHNPYYKKIVWDEAAAKSWDDPELELPTKEYDTSESMTLFRAEFCQWMESVIQQEGFCIGRRLQKYLSHPDVDARCESWMPSSVVSRSDNTRSISESAPGVSFEVASGSSDAAKAVTGFLIITGGGSTTPSNQE